MKAITIVFLVLTISSKAITPIDYLMGAYMIGASAGVVLFDKYWYDPGKPENGLYISPGIDPRMLINGDVDFRFRILYHHNRFEPALTFETFPNIKYESLTFGTNYMLIKRKLSALAGFEVSRISRDYTTVNGLGINIEMRYLINDRLSLSYIGNLLERPDITKSYIYSGYIHLDYRL